MSNKMIYQWVSGRFGSGVDAQVAGERLQVLASAGKLTNSVVLKDAEQPDSPLRPLFEWDDATAAHRYRLRQAGDVIRGIKVQIETNGNLSSPIRAFVTLSHDGDNESVYEDVVVVATDTDKRKQLLQRALDELNEWRQRYADLQEFVKLFTYVDTLMMQIKDEALKATA